MIFQNSKKTCIFMSVRLNNFLAKRNKFYLSTPIFYANAKPHIGHLYTSLIADAVRRFEKMKYPDQNILFMTGTDEHGLKIQHAANRNKTAEIQYVDHISKMYRDLFALYNIKYTDYLRTTENRHHLCVAQLWTRLMENGHIYLGEYSGWYCMADEAFVPENQINTLPDGSKVTLEGNRPVEFVQESNYKFRLSNFKVGLLDWLKGDVVRPTLFKRILQGWVEDGSALSDISVSRPRSRVSWGVPVPGDPNHTIYVWLDALACYLTSAGFPKSLNGWPPDLQIIGKDILKFHGLYWPAFLMGANLSPPRQLLCHSHWLVDGEKMSKSRGNVVDPCGEADTYTSEGFRYFLLREGVAHSDGNYSSVKIKRIVNAELADTLGNLLNRCTGTLVNPRQIIPPFNPADHLQFCKGSVDQLQQSLEALPEVVERFYNNYEFHKGIDSIIANLHLANGFFEREKPWELRKLPEADARLRAVLHITLETLRVCGILLSPIVPELSNKLLSKLNVSKAERNFINISPFSWQKAASMEVKLSPDKVVLFTRLK